MCKEEKQVFTGLKNHSYANNLGFSNALSIKGDPYPQGAFGGKSYIPLSVLERKKLEEIAAQEFKHIGDVIHSHCEQLARVVSQHRSESLRRVLAISFREVFRNVFEHSGADNAVFCAQYWPSRDTVEICIADRGIGFSKSLSEDSRFQNLTDRSALMYSLMPGVSSKAKMFKKKKSIQKSDWDNAGYGLFFAHRLFRKFGWFGLASGSQSVFFSNTKPFSSKPTLIEGSLVSMRLDLSNVEAIEREIKQIQTDAADVKARLGVNGLKLSSIEAYLAGK
ncbi:hypothetical protein [Tabrizicola sp.]|uniref:hypothetical protein n=1 Tax=Tabrizicola sp. TaxID=2005166 RepID=UPI003D2D3013